jgi:hypothetical protein
MADLSTYLRNLLRDHVFRTATFAKPTALHISLHTGDPGRTGANEVTGGSYARVARAPLDANWTAPADGAVENAAAITFPSPTANWGSITHAGVWDAATAGNFLGRADVVPDKTVNASDPAPSFAIGALDFIFD